MALLCKYRYFGLLCLLILYLPLTLAYSYVIPFSKGPDEYINYQYILFVAKHGRLPATLTEKQEAGVKADWQPLYHLVAGAAGRPLSLEAPPPLKVTWQPATRQLIDLVLPRATLVRTEDERPPYRGVYALWQVGRWVSLLLGAGTLTLTYLLGLSVWPHQPALATGATALLVFMPRFLFTHAVLSDDTMLSFCLAGYLLLLTRFIQQPESKSVWLWVGLGLTSGLAIVSKYTAIPAAVGALLTLAGVARQRHWNWLKLGRYYGLFLVGLGLAAGWWVGWVWWHFNQVDRLGPVLGLIRPLLPGASVDDNPSTARLTALLSGQSVASLGEAPGAAGNYVDWLTNTFVTLWGVTVFGAEPGWPYPYIAIMAGLALLGVLALLGLWRVYRTHKLLWSALMLHLFLFVPIPLLRFTLSGRLNDSAQGRHILFPAGPALAALLLAGWLAWVRPNWRGHLAIIAGSLMLAWGVAHLGYLWWAYPPPLPARTTPSPAMQLEHLTQLKFGDTIELAGYQAKPSNDGMTLQLELLWRSLAQAWEDYQTEITLVDSYGQTQLRWISQPAAGRFPVRAWQPGDVVRDTLFIPLAGLPADTYTLTLRLLGWDSPLPAAHAETVVLTKLDLSAPPSLSQVALWQADKIVKGYVPAYRYRATIPVTLPQPAAVALVGPAEQSFTPLAEAGPLRIFMVDYHWPSGEYRLQLDGRETDLTLKVDNFSRNFTPPPTMAHPVQANFANQIELLGYDLPTRRVQAGSGLPLVLYWRGLTQMREDYTIFVQLLDAALQRRGGYDRLPRENYNTYLWVPGEVVDDGFAVPVAADAPDGVYTVRVGWYRQRYGQAESLPLVQPDQPLPETSVVIGPVKVGGPPAGVVVKAFEPDYPLKVDLGGTIGLRGYDLAQTQDSLQLALYWTSLKVTDSAYTVFVHVRDAAGQTVSQADHPPANGQYPTLLWDAGEVIPDRFSLRLPGELKLDRYQIWVGLYQPDTGARLPIPETADNSLLLTEVTIE